MHHKNPVSGRFVFTFFFLIISFFCFPSPIHDHIALSILSFYVGLIVVAPQILPMSFGDEPVNAGDLASIQCAVSKGDFPLEITWMFEGRPVGADRMDYLLSDSGKRVKQLTIEAVAARHAGEYTCVASNMAGSASHSAVLDVNGTLN